MAILKGVIKTKAGDTLYPETSADKVQNLSITSTVGSESITVGNDTLNVVTRDTAQNITGLKKFDTTPQTYVSGGKNLFTHNFSIFTNTGGTGSVYTYFKLPDDGKNYTLSVRLKDSTKSFGSDNVFGWTVNGGNFDNLGGWLAQGDTIKTEKHIFYANDAGRCVSMYAKTEAVFNKLLDRYYIQLEEGTEMTSYEEPGQIAPGYYDVVNVSQLPTKMSDLTNDVGYITSSYHDSTKANQSSVDAINAKIPSAASSSNQLADKAFVNSSIETSTATFRGTYDSIAEIEALTADDNDYAFYRHIDSAGNTLFDRYKYNGTSWLYEYTLNNSSFTAAQWAAINSGVSTGSWINTTTAQTIDGQKDFEVVPRVKVTHQTHNLPSAYQEVEYIESSGTQYINTGFIPTSNNYGFDIDLLVVDTPNTANGYIGYRSVSVAAIAGDMRYCFIYGDKRLAIRNGVNADNSTSTIILNQKYNFNYSSGSLKINGVEQVSCTQYSANPTFKTFYLFKANTDNYYSADLGTFVGRIYEAKLYDNGTLVRDFIPCYRISDNKPGMYDLETETFFANSGTGDFEVGSDVEPITYESLLTDANFSQVAFSGSYNDLLNKPTNLNQFTNGPGYITSAYHDSTKANQSEVTAIQEKIPSTASSSNQLADKAFVNSSIETATATFRGTFESLQELEATSADLNDYAFYKHTDEVGNTIFDRYKYVNTTPHWIYEYTLNNSSFTAAQWAAINSGVSSGAWVDMSSSQVISGQKDFNTIPRVKVTHQTHNLPDTYQEVEYIESSGTQYINSNYIPNANTKIIFDSIMGVNSISGDVRQGRHGDSQRLSVAIVSNKLEFAIGGYQSINLNVTGQRHLFELDVPNYQGKLDDVVQATFSSITWTNQQTLYFFARHMSSGADGFGNTRNYNIKIYEQNQLIREYVPCYRISDNEPGLYDTENNVFYTNAGTGTFNLGPIMEPITYESLLTDANFSSVAFSGNYNDLINTPTIPTVNNGTLTIQKNGATVNTFTANASSNVIANITVPDNTDYVDLTTNQIINGQKDFDVVPRVKVEHTIHNLPNEYQEVEYLESTGTQYIDTGVVLTNLHAVEINYQLTSTQQTNRRGLYGILSTNAASRFGSLFSPTNYQLEHGYGVTNVYWQQGLPDANRHLLKQDKNITYMDGVAIHTFNEATFTTTGNALLGNFNYTNYIPALARYYESKWWNDGVLIRDFIPCYRKSDDKPGYYDIVNDVFYTNAGTGDFVLGPNVEPITYESLLTDANFAQVAFSGNYNDLVNKPTIPTVNNATLTIQKNGTSVGTFTANASSNVTANIAVPTATSDLTNDSGFVTADEAHTYAVGNTNYKITFRVVNGQPQLVYEEVV